MAESTEFTTCKEIGCSQLAEVTRRGILESTDGPVMHIGTICINKHVLFMAEDKWNPNQSLVTEDATPPSKVAPQEEK